MAMAFSYQGATSGDLAAEEDETVDEKKYRSGERLSEKHPKFVLEEETCDAGRDGRDHEEPGEPLVRRGDSSCAGRVQQTAENAQPVPPIKGDEGQRSPDVQRDHKGKPERFWLLSDATRLCQLNRAGNTTVWPRLETGKSSVTP